MRSGTSSFASQIRRSTQISTLIYADNASTFLSKRIGLYLHPSTLLRVLACSLYGVRPRLRERAEGGVFLRHGPPEGVSHDDSNVLMAFSRRTPRRVYNTTIRLTLLLSIPAGSLGIAMFACANLGFTDTAPPSLTLRRGPRFCNLALREQNRDKFSISITR